MYRTDSHQDRGNAPRARSGRLARLPLLVAFAWLSSGCYAIPHVPGPSDEALAEVVREKVGHSHIQGVYEFQASANGGHVTIGGRVDSPNTLKQVVTALALTRGICELSYMGMEFCPPDVPDSEIIANIRQAVVAAIGAEDARNLGVYCEDHLAIVYGTLPSLVVREKVEDAVRSVPGVAKYYVAAEIVLRDPPSDDEVVQAVRRKFRNPLDVYNLLFRAGDIEVASENNIVTLTGYVPNVAGKLAAELQAKRTVGVRYVISRLQIPGEPPAPLPTENPRPSDDSETASP
jgi:osmotically-inducible protein OsmY